MIESEETTTAPSSTTAIPPSLVDYKGDFRQSPEVLQSIDQIKQQAFLSYQPRPAFPSQLQLQHDPITDVSALLHTIQAYLLSFEYNYLAIPFFVLKRSEKLDYVVTQARAIIEASLPIQCVEAVFIGIYLTLPMRGLVRFPVSFKSVTHGKEYRHIVLAIYSLDLQRWGSIGISRRSTLMYYPLEFNRLSDLVFTFQSAYRSCQHHLLTAYVGLPVPYGNVADVYDPIDPPRRQTNAVSGSLKWRALKVRIYKRNVADVVDSIDRFTAFYTRSTGASDLL